MRNYGQLLREGQITSPREEPPDWLAIQYKVVIPETIYTQIAKADPGSAIYILVCI